MTADLPWPPPVGVPYEVRDQFIGPYTEVVAPGAYDGAYIDGRGERAFVVAEDEWNADRTFRTILRFRFVSGS